MNKKISYYKLSLLVIIIGTLLRFALAILHHPSGDACWHLSAARFISENFKIPFLEHLGRAEPFWAPPMFHFIAAFFYRLADGIGMRLVSPMFGSLTLFYTFLIARKIYNEKIAFFSALFLAFLPIHIDYSVFGYVEGLLTFLIVLSVYLLMENRLFLSSVFFGIALLTKYNAVFILPVLFYIIYQNAGGCKRKFFAGSAIFMAVSLIIALPWLIRNYALLGNPIWPFMGFLFKGAYPFVFTSLNIHNILSPNFPVATYLGFFGVPDGNYKTLFFFPIPFFNLLLAIWLIGTLIYLYPFLKGTLNSKKILYLWAGGFAAFLLLYVANVGEFVSRVVLPATPAMAIMAGAGINKIRNKKIFLALALFTILGFIFAESVKITLAANSWNFYNEDFEWVKKNTPKESVILINRGQCFTYNLERPTVYYKERINASYIWVNQNFKVDMVSAYNETTLKEIENNKYNELIYDNEKTKTRIYSVNKPVFD